MHGNQPCLLKLVVACDEEATLEKCQHHLARLEASGVLAARFPEFQSESIFFGDLEQARVALEQWFQGAAPRAALLVSDLLAEQTWKQTRIQYDPTSAAKEIHDQFRKDQFASLAVVGLLKRVPEIDHVVQRDFGQSEFLEALCLAIDKLTYISSPTRRRPIHPVVVKEIQREHEMREYFKLRHRVYNIMGYVEEQCWNAPSGMEMDWCDTMAIHLGAFEIRGARRKLVGAARVVSTQRPDVASSAYANTIARGDPVLVKELNRSMLPLHLPVFHSARSARLNEILIDVEEQELNCGELSRVIVDKDYRGMGLAYLLVKFAVFRANEAGIDPLLLECLDIHVPLYEKFGFRRIPGEENRVLGVQKSMIAMELTPVTDQVFISGADVYVSHDRLCACREATCYKGFYPLVGTGRCPLEGG